MNKCSHIPDPIKFTSAFQHPALPLWKGLLLATAFKQTQTVTVKYRENQVFVAQPFTAVSTSDQPLKLN